MAHSRSLATAFALALLVFFPLFMQRKTNTSSLTRTSG